MSAWIVSKRHIDCLVTGLAEKNVAGLPRTESGLVACTEIGRILWRENLSSIHYRYPDTKETDSNYPGPNDFTSASVPAYVHAPYAASDGVLLKAAMCYRYQSCEHPGWEESQACVWITNLIDQLERLGVEPDGPWGID